MAYLYLSPRKSQIEGWLFSRIKFRKVPSRVSSAVLPKDARSCAFSHITPKIPFIINQHIVLDRKSFLSLLKESARNQNGKIFRRFVFVSSGNKKTMVLDYEDFVLRGGHSHKDIFKYTFGATEAHGTVTGGLFSIRYLKQEGKFVVEVGGISTYFDMERIDRTQEELREMRTLVANYCAEFLKDVFPFRHITKPAESRDGRVSISCDIRKYLH